MQRLFRSFREASISSATRRETPASCLVCHDRPSRTRYSSLPSHPSPPPESRGALYFERVGNDRNGTEKEKSHERGGKRRRRTVARVATSIRFSSSCGEVVKTFLLPPRGWRRDVNGSFRVLELCYYYLPALLTRAIVPEDLRGKKGRSWNKKINRKGKNDLLTKRENYVNVIPIFSGIIML